MIRNRIAAPARVLQTDPAEFFRLIREEPVLQVQYPRYKPYLDSLEKEAGEADV